MPVEIAEIILRGSHQDGSPRQDYCPPELRQRDLLPIVSRPVSGHWCRSCARVAFGFARCRERVTFLCLCKEKVTKRKHTPSVAPGASRRVHGFRGVFRQHIRVLVEKRAASCRAPFGPHPRIPSRPGAPEDQDQACVGDVTSTSMPRGFGKFMQMLQASICLGQ